ncbi:MAG TPA: hypothetical protein VKJ01_01820 [Candidatus Solibacter sp.]|nr:hypothetical protein [Candidatus Solibacter sp.]
MGWGRLLDGPLLQLAAQRFDVLLTIDRSIEFGQNLSKLGIGLIVVETPKNQMRGLMNQVEVRSSRFQDVNWFAGGEAV